MNLLHLKWRIPLMVCGAVLVASCTQQTQESATSTTNANQTTATLVAEADADDTAGSVDEVGPLSPTVIRAGWNVFRVERLDAQQYGPIDVRTIAIESDDFNVLDELTDDPSHELVDLTDLGDGIEGVLISRDDGTQRLGFTLGNWFYDLEANNDTDRADLLWFARGFEITEQPLTISNAEFQFVRTAVEPEEIAVDGTEILLRTRTGDPTLSDACVFRREAVVDESDSEVRIRLFELRPVELAISSDRLAWISVNCQLEGFAGQIVRATLDEPLGDRTVRSGESEVVVLDAGALRWPTILPAEWGPASLLTTNEFNVFRGNSRDFGPVRVDVAFTTSLLPGERNVVETIEGNPDHEVIDVIGEGDGRVVTRGNGVHRLGFINGDWSYDLLADATVNRDDLIAFARSFD